jgi:hypothetical protein
MIYLLRMQTVTKQCIVLLETGTKLKEKDLIIVLYLNIFIDHRKQVYRLQKFKERIQFREN